MDYNTPIKIFISLSIDGKELSEIDKDIETAKEQVKEFVDPRQKYELIYVPLTDVVHPSDWAQLKDDNHDISLKYLQKTVGVIRECDYIFFAGDLADSKNSRIEFRIANDYGIRMFKDY